MKMRTRHALIAVLALAATLFLGCPASAQQPSPGSQNTCGSTASSCVIKAGPGQLVGVYADCTAACWLMIFNSTTAPANGATTAGPSSGTGAAAGNLVDCINIATGDSRSLTYPLNPRRFDVGITVAISSTSCGTLTLSTVGFISGTAF